MRISFCCANTHAPPWLDGLRAALPGAEVSLWQPGAAPADYAVVWSPPQHFFDEQSDLQAAFNIGAGVDALLRLRLPPTTRLVRLQDAGMAVQMAEYVCHAVIDYYRGFAALNAQQPQGVWQTVKPPPRSEFSVGVLGLGVLGSRVAQALRTFEFPVRGWSRTSKPLEGIECFAGTEQLSQFLAGTRVLVCLPPLTAPTENILCRANLSQLPAGAYVINVARGAHVVDDDLLALLDSGQLAGATLDVFRTEPLPPEHPFWKHPKIRVTPHTSARTMRDETIAQIASQIKAFERGESLRGVVDLARGY